VSEKTFWDGPGVKVRGIRAINMSAVEAALVVERQAIALCPVDTGRLRGSITIEGMGESTQVVSPATSSDKISGPDNPENEIYVGSNVDYAAYLEYGTRSMDAQAYLRPALALAKGRAVTIIEKNGKLQLKEYLRENQKWYKDWTSSFEDGGGI